MKKYRYKIVQIEIEHTNYLDIINQQGEQGWRAVRFSDSYEKSGKPFPMENEIWVMDIVFEKEV